MVYGGIESGWPAPVLPPSRTPLTRKIILGGLGVALAATAIVTGVLVKNSSDGDSFYAAGWTVSRAADLSVQMQQDDGISRLQAQCATKDIAGRVAYSTWEALDELGRLMVIRFAEDDCF